MPFPLPDDDLSPLGLRRAESPLQDYWGSPEFQAASAAATAQDNADITAEVQRQTELERAVSRGAYGLRKSIAGGLRQIGNLTGTPEGPGAGERNAELDIQRAAPKGATRLRDVHSLADVGDLAANVLGEQVPALAVYGGAAGLGRRFLGGILGKEAAMTGGVVATGALAGAGTVAQTAEADPEVHATPQEIAKTSLAAGGVEGALFALPVVKLLRRLGLGKAAENAIARPLAHRIAAGAFEQGTMLGGIGALTPVIHHGAMEVLKHHADLMDPATIQAITKAAWDSGEIAEGAFAGGLGGAVLGGLSGLPGPLPRGRIGERLAKLKVETEHKLFRKTNTPPGQEIFEAEDFGGAGNTYLDNIAKTLIVSTKTGSFVNPKSPSFNPGMAARLRDRIKEYANTNVPASKEAIHAVETWLPRNLTKHGMGLLESVKALRNKPAEVVPDIAGPLEQAKAAKLRAANKEGLAEVVGSFDELPSLIKRQKEATRVADEADAAEADSSPEGEFASQPEGVQVLGPRREVLRNQHGGVLHQTTRLSNLIAGGDKFKTNGIDKLHSEALRGNETFAAEHAAAAGLPEQQAALAEYHSGVARHPGSEYFMAHAEGNRTRAEALARVFAEEHIKANPKAAAHYDPARPLEFTNHFEFASREVPDKIDALSFSRAQIGRLVKALPQNGGLRDGDIPVTYGGKSMRVHVQDLVMEQIKGEPVLGQELRKDVEGAQVDPVIDKIKSGLAALMTHPDVQVGELAELDKLTVFTRKGGEKVTFGDLRRMSPELGEERTGKADETRDDAITDQDKLTRRSPQLDILTGKPDERSELRTTTAEREAGMMGEGVEHGPVPKKITPRKRKDVDAPAPNMMGSEREPPRPEMTKYEKSPDTKGAPENIAAADKDIAWRKRMADKVRRESVVEDKPAEPIKTPRKRTAAEAEHRRQEDAAAGRKVPTITERLRETHDRLADMLGVKTVLLGRKEALQRITDRIDELRKRGEEPGEKLLRARDRLQEKSQLQRGFFHPHDEPFIYVNPDLPYERQVMTLTHELGHAVMEQARIDPKIAKDVIGAYHAWMEKNGKTVPEAMLTRSNLGDVARYLTNPEYADAFHKKMAEDSKHAEYFRSMPEWFAEQTARFLTSDKRPVGVIEQFFHGIAQKLKELYQQVRRLLPGFDKSELGLGLGLGPDPSVVKFYDWLLDRREHIENSRETFKKTLSDYAREVRGETRESKTAFEIHKQLGKEGIPATHNSPHKFDQFNWRQHMGSGQGSQSFGAGTYLSTAEGVHKSYKEEFSESSWAGSVKGQAFQNMANAAQNIDYWKDQLVREKQNLTSNPFFKLSDWDHTNNGYKHNQYFMHKARDGWWYLQSKEPPSEPDSHQYIGTGKTPEEVLRDAHARSVAYAESAIADYQRAYDRYKQIVDTTVENSFGEGRAPSYHVTIRAKPEELLDWNKPLSEQSDLTKRAYEAAKTKFGEKKLYVNKSTFVPTGESLYNSLVRQLGSQRAASDWLQAEGVVGHKYAAHGGREEQFPNYVIYDDSRIEQNYVHFDEDIAVGAAFDPAGPAGHIAAVDWYEKLGKSERTVLGRALIQGTMRNQLLNLVRNDPNIAATIRRGDIKTAVAYGYQFWQARGPDGQPMLKVGDQVGRLYGALRDLTFKALGVIRDDENALRVLDEIASGRVAARSEGAAGLSISRFRDPVNVVQAGAQNLVRMLDGMAPLLNAIRPIAARMYATANPILREITNLITPRVGETDRDAGMLETRRQYMGEFLKSMDTAIKGLDEEQTKALHAWMMDAGKVSTDRAVKQARNQLRASFEDMWNYAREAGLDVGKREDYFPWVFDENKLMEQHKAFVELLSQDKFKAEVAELGGAEKVFQTLQRAFGYADSGVPKERAPFAPSINKRVLDFIRTNGSAEDMQLLTGMMSDNFHHVLGKYVSQITRRAEFSRRFGAEGEGLEQMLAEAKTKFGASDAELQLARNYVDSNMGLYGAEQHPALAALLKGADKVFGTHWSEIDPRKLRQKMGAIIVYENLRVLSMALIGNLSDAVGIATRGGASAAIHGFAAGLKQMKADFATRNDKQAKTALQHLGESMGAIESHALNDILNQQYGSEQLGPTARKINDKFFWANGMSYWNKVTRLAGLTAGRRFLAGLLDPTNVHADRHLAELNLERGDITVRDDVAEVMSDSQRAGASPPERARDDKVRAALNRFIDEAMVRPNAAQRPLWGSHPDLGLFFYLKQYMFGMQEVVLRRMLIEAKHANYGPVLSLLPFVAVAMAAQVVRDAIKFPDGDPQKKNWGLADYAGNGVVKTGLPGVGIFAIDARQDMRYGHTAFDSFQGVPAAQLEQMAHAFVIGDRSAWTETVDSMPAESIYKNRLLMDLQDNPEEE